VSRCREARVPAVLEMLGIPYSGSDPLTLAATLDKDCARRLVASAGVPVPRGLVLAPEAAVAAPGLPWPPLVKPAWEGSRRAIRGEGVVRSPDARREGVAALRPAHRQPILVEEFIDGDELTVGVVGNAPPEVIGVMRVLPNRTDAPFIYSLEVKRD